MIKFIKTVLKNYSIKQLIRAEIEEIVGFIVRNIPGSIGYVIRYIAYKPLFGKIKSMPYIQTGVRFVFMKNICLGHGVLITPNVFIYGRGGVEIGDKTLIAVNSVIIGGLHNTKRNQPIIDQPPMEKKIVIGNDCWIRPNCVIHGGVNLGDGSIIQAGSIVYNDTEPYGIYAGAPAIKICERL